MKIRLRDLPLFGKLLIPFLLLLLVVAAGGLYLVVHDLSSNAQASLNGELLRRSLDARSRIHDRELYLLESVSFAANLDGMAEAVRAEGHQDVADLLGSVPALKTDLEIVTVMTAEGQTLGVFSREAPGRAARRKTGPAWSAEPFVHQALAGEEKTAGFPDWKGQPMLAIASPICAGADTCRPVGVAVVGMRLRTLAGEAAGKARRPDVPHPAVAVYGATGRLLAASETSLEDTSWREPARNLVRRTRTIAGEETGVLYAPLEVGGRPVGTLAVGLPTAPAFAAARDAAFRLGLLFLFAIVSVVGIGALVSRWVLRQVRRLVATSRELGEGNLAARAPVIARDELGELAVVLNGMADQLQASHNTLERRVEERTEEVRRLLRERNELFAGISHELRTPIAVILSEARMMVDPAYTTGRRSTGDTAGTIIASGEQLLARVNEILELARAESGRLEVNIGEVQVPDLFGELRPTAEALTAANELELDIARPSGLPAVRADRSRLKDVLVNLIENAVKYTPAGGRISLAASRRNGSVRMTVTDEGIGIPADAGDRIFEPFYKVPGAEPPRGGSSSGLGLALVKRLVEAQGGTIGYKSRRGGGTTFEVEFPSANQRPRAQTDRRKASTASTRR
jgi:signal transduction histidine kinase